uniref:AB hydrolase-1 domain-containing protein n=1 Tax=Helicotheca tamesis TaxID=374047 RepID=A0A7S2IGQ8_9STRA|eukprot:CAMPEP_0185737880 /NCGR_PEP_ID=MMETSP1171-20130828/31512_1 /TAXON_ID=374046 /ORGANISM="Helicotheca tamensis, Strain CCMP826" /LENGTH=302 /DNA_ID=CAMNT_0028408919 /DNA_START=16 /DNA_END=924 /DNA_ORIENTATION=-
MTPSISKGIISTSLGDVHYITTKSPNNDDDQKSTKSKATPCLAFHMSPRSVDEYADAIPLLSKNNDRIVVAMDELGYGSSSNPKRSCTIDEMADAMLDVAHALQIEKFVVFGSLLGCFTALSLASRYPEKVCAVVLTNLYHYPPKPPSPPSADEDEKGVGPVWDLKEDGTHLVDIWNKRSAWLDPKLNTRATYDEMSYLLKKQQRCSSTTKIEIQDASAFDFANAAKNTKCPVLCIQGQSCTSFFDSIGFDMTGQFEKARQMFGEDKVEVAPFIQPGSLNLINQDAEQWADVVNKYLTSKGL